MRAYYAANPDKQRTKTLRKAHPDATIELYEQLRREQGAECAVCGLPESDNRNGRLHLDHDHKDGGGIRGLLCNRCNMALGLMLDEPERLRAAADYLER